MGVYCRCGSKAGSTLYPSELEGWLYWDTEKDANDDAAVETILSFIAAVKSGDEASWKKDFYGGASGGEPLVDKAVIEDILSRTNKRGRSVLKCKDCGRLYIESDSPPHGYVCYEPTMEQS